MLFAEVWNLCDLSGIKWIRRYLSAPDKLIGSIWTNKYIHRDLCSWTKVEVCLGVVSQF